MHVEVEVVAHRSVHQGERMYVEFCLGVVFQIEESEGVGVTGPETSLRSLSPSIDAGYV